jgi:hypothetical protein
MLVNWLPLIFFSVDNIIRSTHKVISLCCSINLAESPPYSWRVSWFTSSFCLSALPCRDQIFQSQSRPQKSRGNSLITCEFKICLCSRLDSPQCGTVVCGSSHHRNVGQYIPFDFPSHLDTRKFLIVYAFPCCSAVPSTILVLGSKLSSSSWSSCGLICFVSATSMEIPDGLYT